MNTNRKIAVVAGVAFLIATIAQIVGMAAPVKPHETPGRVNY
jgi:hypothetical protein